MDARPRNWQFSQFKSNRSAAVAIDNAMAALGSFPVIMALVSLLTRRRKLRETKTRSMIGKKTVSRGWTIMVCEELIDALSDI